jgi:hypothetical protein
MRTKMSALQHLSLLKEEKSFLSLLHSFPLFAILVAGAIHSLAGYMAITCPLLNLHEIDIHIWDSNILHNKIPISQSKEIENYFMAHPIIGQCKQL